MGTQAPIQRTSAPAEPSTESTVPAAPATNEATQLLLAQAKQAREAEAHSDAVVYLERAIRLEPRNSALWSTLAQVHLDDGNLIAAKQHVRKAIALAGDNDGLQRSAWLTLADIREAEGAPAEAASIRRRYQTGRG